MKTPRCTSDCSFWNTGLGKLMRISIARSLIGFAGLLLNLAERIAPWIVTESEAV